MEKIARCVALVVVIFSLLGCAHHHHSHPHSKVVAVKAYPRGKVVVVRQAPPAPRVVTIRPRKPVAHAVWIDGHWHWNGARYVWRAGRWDANPRGVWVSGYWKKRRDGWVWISGRWVS